MKSNYMSDKLAAAEKELNEITNLGKKTIYLVTPGEDTDHALRQNIPVADHIERLKNEGLIQESTVVSSFFKSAHEQAVAIKKWNSFWHERKDSLLRNLEEIGTNFKF